MSLQIKSLILATAFIIYAPACLFAQKSTIQDDPEIKKLISTADEKKGKETGALILLRDYRVTVNEKHQSRLVFRVVGKIFTREAMDDYSTIPLGFNSYYEDITLNYARVYLKDGSTREVPRDAVQIKTTPESQGLQYTDSKFLSFALPGLEEGAAFDYQVTITDKLQRIEGEWVENHWFGGMLMTLSPPYSPRIDPALTSIYSVTVPAGTKLQYRLYSSNVQPKIETIQGQDKYEWVLHDLPAIKPEEAMPALSKIGPILVTTTLKDWAQIDKWAAEKILSRVEVTKELALKARELTAGIMNDDDKIKAIAGFIQGNIRYVYADLNRGGFTPHHVNEILSSKYGDCKDKSILMVSMLKAIGIEAYPALINPFPLDETLDLPSPDFSHLITYIPHNKKNLWLDMTSDVTPFPNLPVTDQNRLAFIINGVGGKLITTPVSDENGNASTFELKSSIINGRATMNLRFASGGMDADVLKSVFKQVDESAKEEGLKQVIRGYIDKVEFDKILFSDVNDPQSPFGLNLVYHQDSVWRKGQSYFTWGSHTMLPLSLFAGLDGQIPEKRTYDLVRPYSYKITGTENYVSPEKDLMILTTPRSDSLKTDFFDFRQNFSVQDNNLKVSWTYVSHSGTVTKDKFNSYLNSIKLVKNKISWTLTYVDPVEYIISLNSENPYNVVSSCNKTLLTEPNNLLALMARGVAFNKLKQDDNAARDLNKALELAPDNKYPHLFITYSSEAKKNPQFIMNQLSRALEIDPHFEAALLARAYIFADRQNNDAAMKDIDAALTNNPRSFKALNGKGLILVKSGKLNEGYGVLEKALKADSTNLMLCLVLGQGYLEIDSAAKAIEFFNKAITMGSVDANIYGNLGWAWYLANDDQKCIQYSEQAASLDSKAYYARYNMALAYLRSGNISESRKQYAQLNSELKSIKPSEVKGARLDLDKLRAKGKYVNEIKGILKDYF